MTLKFVNMMLQWYGGRSSHILENIVMLWFKFSLIYEKKNFRLIKHNVKYLSLKTSFTLNVIENDILDVFSITILIWIIDHGNFFSRLIANVIFTAHSRVQFIFSTILKISNLMESYYLIFLTSISIIQRWRY